MIRIALIIARRKSTAKCLSCALNHGWNSVRMDIYEVSDHPFVVRIWLEETVEEAGQASWRGHVTHVPSGKRYGLRELEDVIFIILPYLEGMGVQPSPGLRLRRWLRKRNSQPGGAPISSDELPGNKGCPPGDHW